MLVGPDSIPSFPCRRRDSGPRGAIHGRISTRDLFWACGPCRAVPPGLTLSGALGSWKTGSRAVASGGTQLFNPGTIAVHARLTQLLPGPVVGALIPNCVVSRVHYCRCHRALWTKTIDRTTRLWCDRGFGTKVTRRADPVTELRQQFGGGPEPT